MYTIRPYASSQCHFIHYCCRVTLAWRDFYRAEASAFRQTCAATGYPTARTGGTNGAARGALGAGGTRRVGLGHPGGRRDDGDVSTGKTFEGQPAENDDKTGDTSNS